MSKRKWIIALGAVAALAGVGWIAGRMGWRAVHYSERIAGSTAIPKPRGLPGPLEKGQTDWPCWRGPQGDGQSLVTGIKMDWSQGLERLWQVDFLCQGSDAVTWSAPVVQGNRLVVPGRGQGVDLAFCLDPATGALIWVGTYEARARSGHGPGPRATPCIDEDRVYTFGRSGDLVCWSLQDGRLLWRHNVREVGGQEPLWGHACSPLIYRDRVIVQGGGSALVVAYDKMTGALVWKSLEGQAGYASCVLQGAPEPRVLLAVSLAENDANGCAGDSCVTLPIFGLTRLIWRGYIHFELWPSARAGAQPTRAVVPQLPARRAGNHAARTRDGRIKS